MAKKHKAHMSHGSPASKGASIGPGPVAGAGELHAPVSKSAPMQGATQDNALYPNAKTPSAKTSGMKVEREGE
jgi:hypothetical protein